MNNFESLNMKQLNFCRLNIQLTRRCNQRCKSCNSYNFNDESEISYDEIENTIRQVCKSYDIRNIAFTGGEPTLRKDLLDILKMANKYCKTVSITTNGSYIKSKQDAIKLINSGVSRFTISYHGQGFHDEFVGIKNAELKVRKALLILSELKNEMQLDIKVGMLISNDSIHTIEQMMGFCKMNNLKLYLELPDDELPIFKNNLLIKDELSDESKKKIIKIIHDDMKLDQVIIMTDSGKKYIEKYLKKDRIQGSCPLGYTDIYVASSGDIYSGCWVLDKIGNIREDSIANIMNLSNYLENLNKMLQRQCPNCTCGYLFQSKYMNAEEEN